MKTLIVETLEDKKNRLHSLECEQAAMAYLREKGSRAYKYHQKPTLDQCAKSLRIKHDPH